MKNFILPFLALSVFFMLSCEGDDGEDGAIGPQGDPGLTEPSLFQFTTFLEEFDNGSSLDLVPGSNSSDWDTDVIPVDFETNQNTITADNSNTRGITPLNSASPQTISTSVVVTESTVIVSDSIMDSQITSITIQLPTVGDNSALFFDAFVSSESNFDFLRWSLNGGNIINGISGAGTDAEGNQIFLGPFEVLIPLESGTNTLTIEYRKDGSISRAFDAGAIDNLRIVDVNAFNVALESFEGLRTENNTSGLVVSSVPSTTNGEVVFYNDRDTTSNK
jgi:hypothetical protein